MVDGTLADASRAEELAGRVPSETRSREILEPIFQRVLHRATEPVPTPVRPTDPPARAVRQLDEDPHVILSPRDNALWLLLQQRIRTLLRARDTGPLGAPSWRSRVLAAVCLYRHDRARGAAEIVQVVRDSDSIFGPWARRRPHRVQVGGGP